MLFRRLPSVFSNIHSHSIPKRLGRKTKTATKGIAGPLLRFFRSDTVIIRDGHPRGKLKIFAARRKGMREIKRSGVKRNGWRNE